MIGKAIKFVALLLVILAAGLLAPSAFAQLESNDVIYTKRPTPGGQCPSPQRMEELMETFDSDIAPTYTFVLEPDKVRLVEAPVGAARRMPKQLEPLDMVEFLAPSSKDEPFFLVRIRRFKGNLRKGNQKGIFKTVACGWLSRRDLSAGLLPTEKNGEIEPLQQGDKRVPTAYRVKGSTITLKAVTHSLTSLGAAIKVYSLPSHEAPVVRKIRQFEIFDVFDVRPDARARGGKFAKKHFFLLGRRSTGANVVDILGWVHEEDIAIWSTRMAVYWTGKGGVAKLDDGTIALRAPKGATPDAGEQVEAKYPLLTTEPEADEITKLLLKKKKKSSRKVLRMIKKVRAVVPGQACAGEKCISGKELARLQQQLHKQVEKARVIDIVFLIDGTTSMTPYFKAVAVGVRDFVNELAEGEDTDLSVAVSIYGDYTDSSGDWRRVEYERVVGRHNPAEEDAMELLLEREKQGALGDKYKDKLEAPLAAVIRVLNDKSRWRDNSGIRFLVHIADHGSRTPGEEAYENLNSGEINVRITPEDVVRALREKEVVYVPIALRNEPEVAALRFQRQANDIVKQLKGAGMSRELEVLSPDVGETAKKVYKALKIAIEVKREAIKRTVQQRMCHEQVEMPVQQCLQGMDRQVGGLTARIAEGLRERLGIRKLANEIYQYEQRTLPVWIEPFQDDKQVIDFWIMLDADQAGDMWRLASALCRKFTASTIAEGFNELREALAETACATAGEGEDEENQSTGECLKKAYFIPGWAITEVLGTPWKNLRRRVRELGAAKINKWNKHFCKRAFLLKKAINENRKVIDEGAIICDQEEEGGMHRCYTYRRNLKRFLWKYDYGSQQVYYFIPLRFLP